MPSQNTIILQHLRTKGSLTTLEAAKRYAITKLPNRISELEEKGIPIRRIEHESTNPGCVGNYLEYSIEENG